MITYILQVALIDSIQSSNVGITGLLNFAPVELVEGYIETIVSVITDEFGMESSVVHDLLGDTSDIDTGTSKTGKLDQTNGNIELTSTAGTSDTSGTSSNNKIVELLSDRHGSTKNKVGYFLFMKLVNLNMILGE